MQNEIVFLFSMGWGTVVGNGVVVGCGGGGGGVTNLVLYVILEPYTKVQVYHVSPLST